MLHTITQSCVLLLWIHTLSFVKSQECLLADFKETGFYDSNFNTSDMEDVYASGKQVKVGCIRGFHGSLTMLCSNGEWMFRGTRCHPKQCPVIHVDNNIQVIGNTENANYQDVLQFSCNLPNYVLVGFHHIYCNEDGMWSGPAPKCEVSQSCGRAPPLENGDTKALIKDQYNHNEKVEYVCQTYHSMWGGPYRICINGEWTGEMRCLKPCVVDEELRRTNNISVKYANSSRLYIVNGDAVEFTCTTGRPTGTVGMRQMCNDGSILLPTCQ